MEIEWSNPLVQKHTISEAVIFNQNGVAVGHKVKVTDVNPVGKNDDIILTVHTLLGEMLEEVRFLASLAEKKTLHTFMQLEGTPTLIHMERKICDIGNILNELELVE